MSESVPALGNQQNAEEYGNWLKEQANPEGGFVEVDITNLYLLFSALARFFKYKHHEWFAICFVDENYRCRRIWFNKGPTRKLVFIMLPEELVLETAQEVGAKWIIAAHNHPYSSKDPKPGLGPFEYIFTTDVEEKRRSKIRDFSAADKESADAYAEYLSKHGIGHGEIVFVTGKWKHNLPDELEQHYQQVVPQGCLVALLAVPIAS